MPQLPEHVHSTDKQCWGSSPWPALMKLTKAPVTTAMPWAWRPSCRRSRSNHLNAVSHEIEPKKRMSFIAIRGKKTAPTRMTPRFTIHATDGQADQHQEENFAGWHGPKISARQSTSKPKPRFQNPLECPAITDQSMNPETQLTDKLMSVEWPWMSRTRSTAADLWFQPMDLILASRLSVRESVGLSTPTP